MLILLAPSNQNRLLLVTTGRYRYDPLVYSLLKKETTTWKWVASLLELRYPPHCYAQPIADTFGSAFVNLFNTKRRTQPITRTKALQKESYIRETFSEGVCNGSSRKLVESEIITLLTKPLLEATTSLLAKFLSGGSQLAKGYATKR